MFLSKIIYSDKMSYIFVTSSSIILITDVSNQCGNNLVIKENPSDTFFCSLLSHIPLIGFLTPSALVLMRSFIIPLILFFKYLDIAFCFSTLSFISFIIFHLIFIHYINKAKYPSCVKSFKSNTPIAA